MFINKQIGSDVKSWLVTSIDETKGTAWAVEVEKKIDLSDAVPGGFFCHVPNLHGKFAAAEPTIKEGHKPFRIKRNKDGVWGCDVEVVALGCYASAFKTEWLGNALKTGEAEMDEATKFVTTFELTKGGKRKRRFEKLGNLCSVCLYFHDYNF